MSSSAKPQASPRQPKVKILKALNQPQLLNKEKDAKVTWIGSFKPALISSSVYSKLENLFPEHSLPVQRLEGQLSAQVRGKPNQVKITGGMLLVVIRPATNNQNQSKKYRDPGGRLG